MQTLAQTFVALCTLVAWPSVVAFLVPPQSHHHHPYRPTTTTTIVATQRSVRQQSYLHYRQQQHPNHDDSNHDDNQEPASSSSSSFGSNSIQQLDIDDRLLSDFFETVPSLQHWLYHGLSKIQSSDISWLQSSSQGHVLSVSPLSLIVELLTSLGQPPPQQQQQDPPTPSLPTRMKFRFELQRCFLKALSHDPLALADVLQMGQSNTHPLGYSLVALPPHSRLPLAIVPSLHCTTVLMGTLCLQQASHENNHNNNVYWDPDVLCRQWHHCVGTPLSHLSSPPTEQDLLLVAHDVQQRVDEQLVPPPTTTNQEPLLLSPFSTTTTPTTTTAAAPSIKLHRRQYASAGSFVTWKTGTMVSMSTHEQPCLLLCLSSQLPTIHYKPPPPPSSQLSSSSAVRFQQPQPQPDSNNLHRRLFPPRTTIQDSGHAR
jgi:hypothetical protein